MAAATCGSPARQHRGPWRHAVARLACGSALVALGACGNPMPPYPAGLENGDPGVRMRTIKMAGEREDRSVLPLLVERLEDEDEAVRMFAIIAIEKITGTRLGYEYRKPAAERARAVKRWRRYLRENAAPPAASTQPGAA